MHEPSLNLIPQWCVDSRKGIPTLGNCNEYDITWGNVPTTTWGFGATGAASITTGFETDLGEDSVATACTVGVGALPSVVFFLSAWEEDGTGVAAAGGGGGDFFPPSEGVVVDFFLDDEGVAAGEGDVAFFL